MNALREGLAKAMYYADVAGLNDYDAWDELREDAREYGREMADVAIAYIRQHDGHEAFVRKILEQADDERFTDAYSINRIIALCAAELAKIKVMGKFDSSLQDVSARAQIHASDPAKDSTHD